MQCLFLNQSLIVKSETFHLIFQMICVWLVCVLVAVFLFVCLPKSQAKLHKLGAASKVCFGWNISEELINKIMALFSHVQYVLGHCENEAVSKMPGATA